MASDVIGLPTFEKGTPVGSRRTLITIAAVLVGALAVFMIYGYVGSVKDEAFGEAERVKVFVVKQGVPKGTYGEETSASGVIAEDEIPKKFWPENAIRSFDDIAGKVAVGDLAVNQVVTTDMFADPSTVQTTFSDRLEKINGEDQVAISIQVDQVHGVAGLLQPGDFVNIMATRLCPVSNVDGAPLSGNSNDTTEATPEGEGEGEAAAAEGESCDTLFEEQARYIYQKVQILAIDQTPVQLARRDLVGLRGGCRPGGAHRRHRPGDGDRPGPGGAVHRLPGPRRDLPHARSPGLRAGAPAGHRLVAAAARRGPGPADALRPGRSRRRVRRR